MNGLVTQKVIDLWVNGRIHEIKPFKKTRRLKNGLKFTSIGYTIKIKKGD